MSYTTPPRRPGTAAFVGGLLAGVSAGPIAGITLFIAGVIASTRIDQAQGHPGGESDAGFVALGTFFGAVVIAITFVVIGAVIGAIVAATGARFLKAVGWSSFASAVLVGTPPLLWALKLSSDLPANRLFTFTLTGVAALAGAVAWTTAGFVGWLAGRIINPSRRTES